MLVFVCVCVCVCMYVCACHNSRTILLYMQSIDRQWVSEKGVLICFAYVVYHVILLHLCIIILATHTHMCMCVCINN